MATIKVLVHHLADGTKVTDQVGDFKVHGTYQLTGGFHSGRLIKLTYISSFKQVIIDGQRHRKVSGILKGDNTRINATISQLQVVQ